MSDGAGDGLCFEPFAGHSGDLWLWHRDQLGEFPEVLGGGGEVELITGATGPAQS